MKLRVLCAVAVAAVLLAACGGSDPADPRGELIDAPAAVGSTLAAAQIDGAAQAGGLHALAGAARCDVKVIRLNYRTAGVRPGETSNASGVLLLPTGPADTACATAAAPLVAYSRGTSVDKSRVMANAQDPETRILIAMLAAQGYAVVATDYLGYGASTYPYHPYLHADSEATSVIDSVRAARKAAAELGRKLSGKVMFTGFSQGGHASMAAQRAAERDYGNEFDVAAGAHAAGPYNLADALKDPQAIAGYQFFIPFLVTAWQKVYGNVYANAADVFKAPYASGIDNLLPAPNASYASLIVAGKVPYGMPNGTPDEARADLMQPAFVQTMRADDSAPISVAARKNTLLGWKPRGRVLLCGAAADPTIPPAVHQVPMRAHFAAQGVTVDSVDVDPDIQAAFGPVPTDPASAEYADYYGNYHDPHELLTCLVKARELFDRVR